MKITNILSWEEIKKVKGAPKTEQEFIKIMSEDDKCCDCLTTERERERERERESKNGFNWKSP